MQGPSLGRRFQQGGATLCVLAARRLALDGGVFARRHGRRPRDVHRHEPRLRRNDSGSPHRRQPRQRLGADGDLVVALVGREQRHRHVDPLHSGDGVAQFGTTPLVVAVPNAPTGAVANPTNDFVVSSGAASGRAVFIFATEDGTIRGWNPGVPPPPLSTQTEAPVDNSAAGSVYKGLAIGSVGTSNFLYATDFVNGHIDVFDKNFQPVVMPFIDPGLPGRLRPVRDPEHRRPLCSSPTRSRAEAMTRVAGQSLGFVDEFETDGTFVTRVATRGQLNARGDSRWRRRTSAASAATCWSATSATGRSTPTRHRRTAPFSPWPVANGRPQTRDHRRPPGASVSVTAQLPARRTRSASTAGPDDESHGLFGQDPRPSNCCSVSARRRLRCRADLPRRPRAPCSGPNSRLRAP